MRKVCLLAGLVLLLGASAMAQDTPKVEVFGGYSYLRVNPGSGFEGINLNGWNASIAGNFNDWFGVVADFSGHYGSPNILGINVDTNTHTFVFGPRFSYRKNERVTPFAHALFGGNRTEGSAFGVSLSETGFAMALGGGVDVKVNDKVAIRIAQADYVLTRLGNDNQHHFRYSAGVVFRFGK
jgi:opacity protein-like surface antigen